MKTNIGTTDRIIRIALAVLFSVLFFTGAVEGFWGTFLLVAGGVLVLTAVLGWCGLYSLLRFNTCTTQRKL